MEALAQIQRQSRMEDVSLFAHLTMREYLITSCC